RPPERLAEGLGRVGAQGGDDFAVDSDALRRLKAELRRDQGRRLGRRQVVQFAAGLPADVQHVPKPRRVTKAVRAPFRSRTALVATVEPCTTLGGGALPPTLWSSRERPSMTAAPGSSGVDRV